jgi:hypothetical protein
VVTSIPQTRTKLEEARFFLSQLHAHKPNLNAIVDVGAPHPAPFKHFLSAFVSAARSVTWVMKHECQAVPGWLEWELQYVPDQEERALLERFNDLRIQTTKKKPFEPGMMVEASDRALLDEQAQVTSSDPDDPDAFHFRLTVVNNDGSIGNEIGEFAVASFGWALEGLDTEVVATCQQYYELLERFVSACEARFFPGAA